MIRQCENCWESYDTEKKGANEFHCSKCNKKKGEEENGMDS
ncbi:hypothetical protein LCGC14_0546080 [marine sediment metagenome]|uniref:Uncharacterized protein n=1 Tax=marine sediment metagenome TaxID=412755 RepID=A0A0F9UZK8_9ZZZZ